LDSGSYLSNKIAAAPSSLSGGQKVDRSRADAPAPQVFPDRQRFFATQHQIEPTLMEELMKLSRFSTIAALAVAEALVAGVSSSQQAASADLRTKTIVASFNKSKHVVREKRGIRKEKYLDVRSVPAVRKNAAEYSGDYDAPDLGFSLHLRADASGIVEGSGREPLDEDATMFRTFTLRNARITGALLTATKVYVGGSSAPLEGVFIDKSTFESPTDKGFTTFGLGVVGTGLRVHGLDIDRVFLQPKQ
jgi:hypothetical protein